MSKIENLLVSISCITYNHEDYIEDTIESFLIQQTNFKFEILIHDDASTDKTAEIIKEYEKKYPDIIKPIYQTENQYSKGVDVSFINEKRANGKYVALCEGDDYWIDPYKLQKQVDYMEKHPECSLCVHGGIVVSSLAKKVRYYNRPSNGSRIFDVKEIIAGGGELFLTNSMIFRAKFIFNRPAFLKNAPVGDYSYAINLALLGTVFYMDDLMSAYRIGDINSWSARVSTNIQNEIKLSNELASMLDEVNTFTNGKYEEIINWRKNYNQFFILLKQRKFNEAKKGHFKQIYLNAGLKRKIIILIDQYFPSLMIVLKSAKRKLVR